MGFLVEGSEAEHRAEQTAREIENVRGSVDDGLAIIITGYAGAGKTTAATEMEDVLEKKFESTVLHIELDVVAEQIEGVGSRDARRDPRAFVGSIAERYALDQYDAVILDGVQSLGEIEEISHYFDTLSIVYVVSHHGARHIRLIRDEEESNEPDMDAVSHDALRKVDKDSMNAGLVNIEESKFYDYELTNEEIDEPEFRAYARYVGRSIYNDYVKESNA